MTEKIHKPGPATIYREMVLHIDRDELVKRSADSSGDQRVPIAISSETPVQRMDWWSGEIYNEVLDHSSSAIDLSYAKDGLPFLDGHDTRQQLGIVEDIAIGADKIMRGMVRFSRRDAATDLRNDMIDGIRKKISVGYRQLETVTTENTADNSPDEVRVTRWLPMEASSVPIPADYSVGVGRSAGEPTPQEVEAAQAVLRRHSRAPHPVPRAKDPTMDENETSAPKNGAPDIRVKAREDERERSSEIIQLATEHGLAERANDWVRSGKSMEEVSKEILGEVKKRMATPTPATPSVDLSAKEAKRFSFARAIAADVADFKFEGKRVEAGLEREVAQELERRLPAEYKRRGGILLPTVMTRAGLDSVTATKGVETKFTQPGEFIDLLRARMKVKTLGARILAGLTGPVSMPRQTASASGSWVGENSGADVGDSNLLVDLVTLAIKTYQASTSFSRQLLISALSGSIDAENMVRDDLAIVHALAMDLAGIAGLGSSNQPKGITHTTGIGSEAGGVNGAAPTYANVVNLETAVANANADVDSMGYLTTPVMRGKLKQTQQFPTSANGLPVWADGEVNGYRAEVSTQVPSTLVKGTSNDCHAIIFGDFSQLIFGEWGVLELITDPFRLKKQGMIEVTSFQMADVAIRQPAAFAAMLDARNV